MTAPAWEYRTACRICGDGNLGLVFDFGATPVSDKLRDAPDSISPAPRIPLELCRCADCTLTQISVDVSPDYLFAQDYPYHSSVSDHLSAHFAASAQDIIETFGIGDSATVVEAASNDGYLLRHFKAAGARVLGIDPATGPAAVARGRGIETRTTFFGRDTATALRAEGYAADVFLANNVLAHVPDLTGFVTGIAHLLKPDGVAVIEVPYLVDLVEGREYDTIYHQHLCYFLVSNLSRLFAASGLCLSRVSRIPIHGGSLRLFVRHGQGDGVTARDLIAQEAAHGQTGADFVARIGAGAQQVRETLTQTLDALLSQGKCVRSYAAAGKATTQLAWCGLDRAQLHSVADLNPVKHGKYMPGTDLPIVPREAMLADNPDHIVILAWNFADEIIEQIRHGLNWKGKFIIPLPEVEIR